MTLIAGFEVDIRQQARQSLALRVTPGGLVALIPESLDPESAPVREFVARGVATLPAAPARRDERLSEEALRARVDAWAARLEVEVSRVQIRAMRTKWASCSSRGTLTVNRDPLDLADGLIAYVLVHELLHLRFPGHGKGWQAMMGAYVPDGQEREAVLARVVVDAER
jgi:hypothetical protein